MMVDDKEVKAKVPLGILLWS